MYDASKNKTCPICHRKMEKVHSALKIGILDGWTCACGHDEINDTDDLEVWVECGTFPKHETKARVKNMPIKRKEKGE